MTQTEINDAETAAFASPTVSSDVVIRLVQALRMAEWKMDNYRKLAAYYRGTDDVGAAGDAVAARAGAN